MFRRPYIYQFAVTGLIIFGTGLANSQEDKPNLDGNPAANERPDVRIDIQFSGGTIDEFVRQLRQRNPTANVVVSEQAGKLTLPSIEMKNITVASALDAVELLTGQLPNPAVSDTIFDDSTQQQTRIITTRNLVKPLEDTVRVINASGALASFRDDAAPKKLIQTIDEGLDTVFEDSSPAISIKLHAETGLLFVKGREDKVEFVMEIISELGKNSALTRGMRQQLGNAESIDGPGEAVGDSKNDSNGK